MASAKQINENNKVATDAELEREDRPLPIGKTAHISTVTHAWRGQVETATESFFYLNNAVLVESTGPAEQYAATKRGAQESKPLGDDACVFVARGAVSWGILWRK